MEAIRLTIVTDAWSPQINGVVHSLQWMVRLLEGWGDTVSVLSPDRFPTIPCPTYPEIRLALATPGQVTSAMQSFRPDFVHIATEGPLGQLARRTCLARDVGFTTSYHTKFPEYVAARLPVPASWLYGGVRRFHNSGHGCMVATASLEEDLRRRGFRKLMRWSRGVDTAFFRPRPGADLGFARPVFLYVGRVAVEKNLEAFLSLDLPGTKVVVGDGPARVKLQALYQEVRFLGAKTGEDLAQAYAAGDVFVFPSLTDTFGNVLLEALASGLPVAAFPVTGPQDVITDPRIGCLHADLKHAALTALGLRATDARDYAHGFSWEESARRFRENIVNGRSEAAQSGLGQEQ